MNEKRVDRVLVALITSVCMAMLTCLYIVIGMIASVFGGFYAIKYRDISFITDVWKVIADVYIQYMKLFGHWFVSGECDMSYIED